MPVAFTPLTEAQLLTSFKDPEPPAGITPRSMRNFVGSTFIAGSPLDLTNWTTATRPANPQIGALGFNTDLNAPEVWTGSAWIAQDTAGLSFVADGGITSRSLQARFKDLRTPLDWGAAGNGTSDDTAAFTAMFTELASENGGRIYISGSYYIAGAVTVPSNVELYGDFMPSSNQENTSQTYFQIGGSKLILGAGITLSGTGCIMCNIMVIANNLPRTNPTTLVEANALIAQMVTNGTAITLAGDNTLIDSVQVLGFNYGIYCNGHADRHWLRNVHGDNINSVWLAIGGDMCHIIGGHFWPYLTVTCADKAAYFRNGYGVYLKSNGGDVQVCQVTCYGQLVCYLVDTSAATFSQCWADGPLGSQGTTGYGTTGACGYVRLVSCVSVAQQWGVHHSPSNGATMVIDGCSLQGGGPGGSTPATGMALGIYADGHGPVQCTNSLFNGGNAMIWLGPNTGASVLTGNLFDDALSNLGYIWNIDSAILPFVTKHSNRVINSTRGLTEQNPTGPITFYDTMSNTFSELLAHSFQLNSSTALSGSYQYVITGGGTDQNVWDSFVSGVNLAFRTVNDANSVATIWLLLTRSGLTVTNMTLTASAIAFVCSAMGFNGTSPIPKPTVTGAWAGNTAGKSLSTALAAYGLITDSTTA